MEPEIKEILSSGQLARLIPIVADSKKEERATSCLLATFMAVPTFAKDVLVEAGAPLKKKLKLSCYTEVAFKSTGKSKKPRPDGLIIIYHGSKRWTALIESKIGNAELTQEQVEEYLDLAKEYNINALITISNQFATTHTHHPIKVPKSKTKSVKLYHFSWLSLVSKAVLLSDNKALSDPEQAYILSELVRYLDHDSSGVSSLTKLHSDWKNMCSAIQHGAVINKSSDTTKNTVSSWHQLQRHLALNLSMAIGSSVEILLPRARIHDSELNFKEDCEKLAKEYGLTVEFYIPHAASKLVFSIDFLRRTLNFSMKLDAPKDRSRASAVINWLTRQLKNVEVKNITVRAYWPKRISMTTAPLQEVTNNPNILVPDNITELPVSLEVLRVIDLASRFKGAKTFVEDASKEFPLFYNDVGQHLSKWVAKAPKVKEKDKQESPIPTMFTSANEIIISEHENKLASNIAASL